MTEGATEEPTFQENPMDVKRGSLVGKSIELSDSAASASGKDRGAPVKSSAHHGERALTEGDDGLVSTDFPNKRQPSDGLAKITRLHSYYLWNDETNSILSPILWASTRKPYISKLRLSNAITLFISFCALGLASYLSALRIQLGVWLLVSALIDIVAGVLCEVGLRRVYSDIKQYANDRPQAIRMKSIEDVPSDTVGQSIIEGYWWVALLQTLHHLVQVVYIFSYPSVASDHLRSMQENDPHRYENRYGSEDPDKLGRTVEAILIVCAVGGILVILLHCVSMWLAVRVTTWFEIVQGFVEHVNALGLVCALATIGVAVKVLEYEASMPDQVDSPSMTPVWVIFAFALACVPLSLGGFVASWTEHRILLRIYASTAFAAAAGFFVLFVYLAAVVNFKEMVGSNSGGTCKKILTFVHEDWWDDPNFIDCSKYVGNALRWNSASSSFEETDSGVGLYGSLDCASKKDDVFAWEVNEDHGHPGPACSECISYYGCLNRKCCDDLGTTLDQSKFLQLMAIFITFLVITMSAVSAIYISKKVSRSSNESILSHLGAKATLSVMVVAIIIGAVVIAVDATNAVGSTASNSKGLGDLPTDYDPADNATGVLPDSFVDGDSDQSSDNANARLRFNHTCLTSSYDDYRSGETAEIAWFAPPLLLPPCDACNVWATAPPVAECSSAMARSANPTMTCVTQNATCYAADLDDGTCNSIADDDVSTSTCPDPGLNDRAVTNGECKFYEHALKIVLPSDVGETVNGDCRLRATFMVNHGGRIEGLCDGDNLVNCQGTMNNIDSYEFVPPNSPEFELWINFTVMGGAKDVARAISNFTFCPSCIDTSYEIVVFMESLNKTACITNDARYNLTIEALTNLEQTFVGSVVDGGCINSVGGIGCYDGSKALDSAEVSASQACFNYTAVQTGGAYSLRIPYTGLKHGSDIVISYNAPGYERAATMGTLGVTSLDHDFGRYTWVGTNYTRGESGYCIDLTTRQWAPPVKCAEAGIDTCAIFSEVFSPTSFSRYYPCACHEQGTAVDDGPFCSISAISRICPGCRPGTSGACMASDGTCYEPTSDDDTNMDVSYYYYGYGNVGTCGTNNDEWCSGWPCSCEYGLTENTHALGSQLLFSVPTNAPTSTPSLAPSAAPTAVPTNAPTSTPSLAPSAAPTAEPTAAPSVEPTSSVSPSPKPTNMPSSEPTPGPTYLPSYAPTMYPTEATAVGGIIVDATSKTTFVEEAIVTLTNVATGSSQTREVTEGSFEFLGIQQATYTLHIEPTSPRYNSYSRTVVAFSHTAGASAHLLIPLARALRGSQMMIVVEWGGDVSLSAYSQLVGVATDLDVYLRFGVSGSIGNTDDAQTCLVYYNSPTCGGATLLTNDGEGDSLSVPNGDDDAVWSAGIDATMQATGVETIYLNPVLETSYSLFIRNSNLDQPLSTSDIRVNIYSKDGQLGETVQPPPSCSNATHYYHDGDDGDDVVLVEKGISSACIYHDTPLIDNGAAHPFWASEENIVNTEFLRMFCLQYLVEDDNQGTVTSTLVSHECQRYMSATAFDYISLDSEACPPSDDDICDSSEGHDGYWHCSSITSSGIYKCPGGAATMVFCPETANVCSRIRGGLSSNVQDPTTSMCF